jgi:molybdopterin converting factor small subunit
MTDAVLSTVTVRVLLFASYAEALGQERLELTLHEPATIADVLSYLRSLPGGDRLPSKPLCALNLSQASSATVIMPGDELAILPPLAGG